MALNNIIRRVSSPKVVPLAFKAAARRSHRHHHHQCSALLSSTVNRGGAGNLCSGNIIFKHALPSSLHRCYSTKSIEDESLIRLLNDEIKRIQAGEIPWSFPFKIVDKIVDNRSNTIMLTREYQGETIDLEFSTYPPQTKDEDTEDDEEDTEDEDTEDDEEDTEEEEEDTEDDEEDTEDEDTEEEEEDNYKQADLRVKVSKKNGPGILVFDCIASPDYIKIIQIFFYSNKVDDGERDFFPYFDDNVQEAFLKYLEIRGVKPSNIRCLYDDEFVVNYNPKTLSSLENFTKFIER